MRVLGSFIPLLILGALVYAAMHRSRSRGTGGPETAATAVPPTAQRSAEASSVLVPPAPRLDLSEDLDRWVAAGLLGDDQRTAILAHERVLVVPEPASPAAAAPGRLGRIPAVAEALGYLGGMLAVIGLALIVSRYWPDMVTAGRLALSGTAAAALLGAGALAREQADPALARLRWFLWLAATAATALAVGVLAVDGLDVAPETTVLACAGSVALLSGLLWRGRERPLQQLTFLVGVAVTVGALVAEVAGGVPVGLAVWAVGATFVALGLRRLTSSPLLTEGLGTLAVLVGAVITSADSGPGLVFLVASAFGLLALASVPGLAPERADRMVLGVLGGIALVQSAPSTLGWFSQEAGGVTGLTTWTIGGLLLFIGARGHLRVPLQAELLGGAGLIGGAALTGMQWHGFAPIFGIVTAVVLVGLGTLPGQVLLSVLGSVGLLVNVPWAIGWFFPGEGRAPLLIMVSGALIIAVAVLLTRMGDRFRHDLGAMHHRRPPGGIIPGSSG